MDIHGIKYLAPFFHSSGYAEAARQYVQALHHVGIPLTLEPIRFDNTQPNLGDVGAFLTQRVNVDIPYNIKIMQVIPEHYPHYREPGVVNIGYSLWEASSVPQPWVDWINQSVDIAFVGCQWNVEMYRDQGVRVPVWRVPHCIDVSDFDAAPALSLDGIGADDFVFYAICEWTERKNPLGLLKAYWRTFRRHEPVALVLKTYRSPEDPEAASVIIQRELQALRRSLRLDDYPRTLVLTEMFSRSQMVGLHQRGDCFGVTVRFVQIVPV